MIRWTVAMAALAALGAIAATRVLAPGTGASDPARAQASIGPVEAASVLTPTPTRLPGELQIRHIQQEPELCVPTAAAMVLDFYGAPQPPRLLKTVASGRTYDPAQPFTDFSITPYRDLIRAVSGLGFQWSERTFPNTGEGFERGIAVIEGALAEREPVMADITLGPGVGHTFVITGFDHAAQVLAIVDPGQPPPGRRLISYAEFGRAWNETAYGGDFRALILTRPKDG